MKKMQEVWRDLMTKCYNDFEEVYQSWGAKGMRVAKRWHTFENFYDDVGYKPRKYMLRPINWKKDIGPDNFEWHDTTPPVVEKRHHITVEELERLALQQKAIVIRNGPCRQSCMVFRDDGTLVSVIDIAVKVRRSPAAVSRKLLNYRRRIGTNAFFLDDFLRAEYKEHAPAAPPLPCASPVG